MKHLLPVLCACVVVLCMTVSVASKRQYHHKNKISHLVKKRSISQAALRKKFHIPISSFVEDVSESTAFRDREKKLKLLASHQGELYHSTAVANKRKYVTGKQNHDKSDDDDDSENDKAFPTTGSKKHDILKDNTDDDKSGKHDDTEDEVDEQSENDAEGEEESGSGENEDDSSKIDDQTDNGNDDRGDENADKDEDNNDENGNQRSGKLTCRKKCTIPLTFHKCAFPRCSMKMGSIKDLCFYLCKHQKEKCEDVCE